MEFFITGVFLYTIYMNGGNNFKKLESVLKTQKASIRYKPLNNEVDYLDCPLFEIENKNDTIIPQDKKSDPYAWADFCAVRCGGQGTSVYVLVPGSKFDIFGTRYGRGGGWYDRFLSKAPRSWIRIGIAVKANLSQSKLKRQKWDEPVDWVVVKSDSFWEICETRSRRI